MEQFLAAILLLVLFVAAAVLARSLALWYWRIGEIADSLKRIDGRLADLVRMEANRASGGQ